MMAHTNVAADFYYIYGVIPREELHSSEASILIGIDQRPVEIQIYQDLAALITPVSSTNYSQQQIDLQLNDAQWLQEKAFHHHQIIAAFQENNTVLPFSFCTIFQNEDNLEGFIIDQYHLLCEKLASLKGKQEWNVKLFCQSEQALAHILSHNPTIVELKQKLTSMPKGKQFLMKKKLDQLLISQFEREQARWLSDIMLKLESVIEDTNLRKSWSKEITERKEEMIGNCDFLICETKVEQFLSQMEELEKSYKLVGCMFQITGPWPPYHFSKIVKEKG
jgi:Gas vesicle synthesis protein GvpL/GvpF